MQQAMGAFLALQTDVCEVTAADHMGDDDQRLWTGMYEQRNSDKQQDEIS